MQDVSITVRAFLALPMDATFARSHLYYSMHILQYSFVCCSEIDLAMASRCE